MAGAGRPGPECGVARALAGLDKTNAEGLELLVDGREADGRTYLRTAPYVAKAMTDLLGRYVGKEVVKHHRRRDCRCA